MVNYNEKKVASPGDNRDIALNDEFERRKKEGYGYFTYDEKGNLIGVAMKTKNMLVPSDDKVA